MFDTLNDIDWTNLSHAYGSAEKAPTLLRQLAFGTEGEQEDALNWLWNDYVHQGSRYDGTYHLIPFLFELLESNQFPKPHELINLLLAYGVGEAFLPEVHDLEWELNTYDSSGNLGSSGKCHLLIRENAPMFLEFLLPTYTLETRLAAGFAFAHFADTYTHKLTQLIEALAFETNPLQCSNLLRCLAHIGQLTQTSLAPDSLLPFLDLAQPKIVRLAAAIAQVNLFPKDGNIKAIETVFQALTEAWTFEEERIQYMWWNEGDMLGYTALVLPQLDSKYRLRAITTLQALVETIPYMTQAIPQTLLLLILKTPDQKHNKDIVDLSKVERLALQLLLKSGQLSQYTFQECLVTKDISIAQTQPISKQIFRELIGDESEVNMLHGRSTWFHYLHGQR
ncbi:MAG: hypothetical protein KDE51_02510 [Anaerolineales bacterium]|nr:hypothetical protein [Anaerolineales bacterium]